jgi:hypothetical protein
MLFCNVLVCVVANFLYLLLDIIVLQNRSCYIEHGLLVKGTMFVNSWYANTDNNYMVTLLRVLVCYERSFVHHECGSHME